MEIRVDKKEIRKLPSFIGVYLFKSKKNTLYVGKSISVKARLLSHLENARYDSKEASLLKATVTLELIQTDSEFKALILESQLIQKNHPYFNVRWKDNKSYLYIKITVKDSYPKVFPVRKENDGKSLYFGPFSSLNNVFAVLSQIRKIFPFCAQKKLSKTPCFYSKIGLCSPCPNLIDQEKNSQEKKRLKRLYRNNIRQIIKVLQGKTDEVEKSLYKKLSNLIKKDDYEKAIEIRNKLFLFRKLISQRLFDLEEKNYHNQSEKSLKELTQLLRFYLPNISTPKRIECYDVSNLSQKEATASMVVLIDGLISRDNYRKFKIKNLKLTSDLQMLEEIIKRRFKNTWDEPNLIVLDGGKPQVRTILRVLYEIERNIPIIGIAKNPDRIVVGIDNLPTIRPKSNNLGFNLIRHIRDESHRFARKYHLYLRNKKLF